MYFSFVWLLILRFFVCSQIGCFMGFSIVICVLAGIMFISYCIALAEFNEILRCRKTGWDWEHGYYGNRYCYSSSDRHMAAVGLGLSSCMLIFTIVEFILALSSSIYCCNAVCCNASTGVVNTVSVVHTFVYFENKLNIQGLYIYESWKVIEFKNVIFQACKVKFLFIVGHGRKIIV